MPVTAKLVTIVAGEEEHDRIAEALGQLGAHGFTYMRVQGHGTHGHRPAAMFDSYNESIAILTSLEVAEKILLWVERELVPGTHAVAYCTDASIVMKQRP